MIIKTQAMVLVTDTQIVQAVRRARTDDEVRRVVVEARVPALKGARAGVVRAAFDRLVADRAADAQPSQWAVGAARDLPVVPGAWDGAAAQRRVFERARFDSDSPRVDIARRAHLIYDRANATLRGGYKLPFADIRGGRLVAVEGALRAAASRLPQTDAPKAVLDRARAVLDAYFEKTS